MTRARIFVPWHVEFVDISNGDGKRFRAVFHSGPFAATNARYRAAGWRGTLPLPAGKKSPPPVGTTGHRASHPTRKQIAAWLGDPTRRGANIALRLAGIASGSESNVGKTATPTENATDAFEIVGIDVDHYVKGDKDKRGGDQLAALIDQLGPLPQTWISSARTDGKSGIRYFRVRAGLTFRGQVDKDIECVYRGYRFAVVWPSTNPDAGGSTYWWFPPGVKPTAEGRSAWNPDTDDLPKVADLPMLPDAWIAHLANGRAAEVGEMDRDSSVDDLHAWAAATFNDSAGDAMCGRMSKAVAQHSERIRAESTSHDKITKAHWNVYQLATEGHTGWRAAIEQIEAVYTDELIDRDKRGRAELRNEIFRSRTNALRKAKADVDKARQIGARLTPSECPCVVPADVPKTITLCDLDGDPVEIVTLRTANTDPKPATAILTVLGPTEWAKPVPPTEFLISKVLCADTFGVNAGPKKSLKTHDNQAIAFAVATGTNLYRNPEFPVKRTGKVLYIVGEGGVVPVRRTLHRMARAYGLTLADVAGDPDFGLIAAFGAAPIDSEAFRDELRRLLDTHQPELVLIESFYNFHPKDVEAANLFSRGQVIDGHHKFVRSECVGATSIMTDHYRSTGGKSLDLDNISMAGQAENADSWITRIHRKDANVADGEFALQTGFGSRQWGGTEWHIDWHLGKFDHDAGQHVGEISWDVNPVTAKTSSRAGSGHDTKTVEGQRQLILAYIDNHEMEPKTKITKNLAKAHEGVGERKFAAAFDSLVDEKQIYQNPVIVTRKYGDDYRNQQVIGWKRAISAGPIASIASIGSGSIASKSTGDADDSTPIGPVSNDD